MKQVLDPNDPRQVVFVEAGGSRGKSSLLRRLEYDCKKHGVATARLPLDEFKDHRPFAAIEAMNVPLEARVRLSAFDEVNEAISNRDAEHIKRIARRRRGEGRDDITVAENANIFGGTVIGKSVENEHNYGQPEMSPELRRRAERLGVEAWLDDIDAATRAAPLVLMFDAYEKCRPETELRQWLEDRLLMGCCPNPDRWKQLVLVVAGREVPPYEEDDPLVEAVQLSTNLPRADIPKLLEAHGIKDPAPYVDLIHRKLRSGSTFAFVGLIVDAEKAEGC